MSETKRRARKGEARAFLDAALRSDTDDCIEYPFVRARNGYGIVKDGDGTTGAHRLVLQMATGQLGEEACHSCHNRACVNPRHLRWGSKSDNWRDRKQSTTYVPSAARLTPADVRTVRRLLKQGMKQKDIAERFGVDPGSISHINTGSTWAHNTEGL